MGGVIEVLSGLGTPARLVAPLWVEGADIKIWHESLLYKVAAKNLECN